MVNNGFVKFNREIVERKWYGEENTLRLYLFLLCSASFGNVIINGREIKRGQYVTSIRKLCEHTHQSFQNIKTALNHLKATHDITVEATPKYSIITLNFYDGETQPETCANTCAGTRANTQSSTRSRSNKEESIKKEYIKEEASAAAPTASAYSEDSCFNSERAELVTEYGEETVCKYESKFRAWAKTKGTMNARLYPTIAKWLAADIKAKPRPAPEPNVPNFGRGAKSSFDTSELKKRLMEKYRQSSNMR